jgi:hypothetical protein
MHLVAKLSLALAILGIWGLVMLSLRSGTETDGTSKLATPDFRRALSGWDY